MGGNRAIGMADRLAIKRKTHHIYFMAIKVFKVLSAAEVSLDPALFNELCRRRLHVPMETYQEYLQLRGEFRRRWWTRGRQRREYLMSILNSGNN